MVSLLMRTRKKLQLVVKARKAFNKAKTQLETRRGQGAPAMELLDLGQELEELDAVKVGLEDEYQGLSDEIVASIEVPIQKKEFTIFKEVVKNVQWRGTISLAAASQRLISDVQAWIRKNRGRRTRILVTFDEAAMAANDHDAGEAAVNNVAGEGADDAIEAYDGEAANVAAADDVSDDGMSDEDEGK